MDFSDIETFLVIASSKSISDAADKLFTHSQQQVIVCRRWKWNWVHLC